MAAWPQNGRAEPRACPWPHRAWGLLSVPPQGPRGSYRVSEYSVTETGSPGTPRARGERWHAAGSWQRRDLPPWGPALIVAFLQKQSGTISNGPGRDLGTAWQLTVWATDAGIEGDWGGGKAGEKVAGSLSKSSWAVSHLLAMGGGGRRPSAAGWKGSGAF